MADEIDIVLVAADRLHGGAESGRTLQIYRKRAQQGIMGRRDPFPDGFVTFPER